MALNFRGPWFWRDGEPLAEAPSVLVEVEEEGVIQRLGPLPPDEKLPGWLGDSLLPLWRRDPRPAKPLSGKLVTMDGLSAFLDGGVPAKRDLIPTTALFDHDDRTGIVVDSERWTAEDGKIYAVRMLSLQPGVGFYAEVHGPPDVLRRLSAVPFMLEWGGEGRRVEVTPTKAIEWPSLEAESQTGTSLILLTTPGEFDAGALLTRLKAVAASVSGHLAVSGWDVALGGPKPNRFAMQAGSVFFLGCPPQKLNDTLCSGDAGTQGWGSFLEGRWQYV